MYILIVSLSLCAALDTHANSKTGQQLIVHLLLEIHTLLITLWESAKHSCVHLSMFKNRKIFAAFLLLLLANDTPLTNGHLLTIGICLLFIYFTKRNLVQFV